MIECFQIVNDYCDYVVFVHVLAKLFAIVLLISSFNQAYLEK